MSEKRWQRRPENSNWGDFGDDDQIGRLNLITPEVVKRGVAEVREGIVFCLSLPLDVPGGRVLTAHRFPPELRAIIRNGQPYFHYCYAHENSDWRDVVCDDAVNLATQYSTQWDGLAHVGQMFDADGDDEPSPVYYNGFRAGSDIPSPADRGVGTAVALGIDQAAAHGIQGRGVLVDLARRFGRERILVDGPMLRQILAEDAIDILPGDILCLYTGYADVVLEMNRSPDAEILSSACAVLDGTCDDLCDWITETGIAAIAADNYAVEAVPPRNDRSKGLLLPLHEHCLFKLGIHLGELWQLGPLAHWLNSHGRSHFLLTAPPLRLPGAVGSPVTPIATV
ncbi:cyclase family protein [Bradyrhizobium roseum]|uniref:cyclase family protein n=1 Tax=Bradyrhizobium roseum TaxID=3056648 RepID=UPI00260DEFBD|nr:cyclase family protein [Bradyrhizobium roseus]WKA26484.1 cyclase family protein [Bradyrhizobium roseus]